MGEVKPIDPAPQPWRATVVDKYKIIVDREGSSLLSEMFYTEAFSYTRFGFSSYYLNLTIV